MPVNEFEDISGLFEIADKDGGIMFSWSKAILDMMNNEINLIWGKK